MHRNAALIGLGVEVIGIGLFVWWPDPPAIVPLLFVLAGFGLILYGAAPWLSAAAQTAGRVRVRFPFFLASPHQHAGTRHAEKTVMPAAEKGFIDFWVDAERAGNQIPKLLTRFGQRTAEIGKTLSTQNKRFIDAAGNAQKIQRVAADAARDIDHYSTFIEAALPELQATFNRFADGWAGYLETSPEARDKSKKGDIGVFRDTVQGLRKTTRTTRESIAGFRNSVLGLRQRNASQGLNAATDRLAKDLAGVVSLMKEFEGAYGRLTGLAEKRLDEMS